MKGWMDGRKKKGEGKNGSMMDGWMTHMKG
jgi:hypothetical protein